MMLEKLFQQVLVLGLFIGPAECSQSCGSPAEEYQEYIIVSPECSSTASGRVIWDMGNDGINVYDSNHTSAKAPFVTVTSSGLKLLNVTRARPTNFHCSVDNVRKVTCDINTYHKPEAPSCTDLSLTNDNHLATECTTAKVFPQAKCEFNIWTSRSAHVYVSDSSGYINYNSTTLPGSPVYYNTTCTLRYPVSQLPEENYTAQVVMYPDLAGIPESAKAIAHAGGQVQLRPPSTAPVMEVSSKQNGEDLEQYDDVTVRCTVIGGFPPVDTVTITCGLVTKTARGAQVSLTLANVSIEEYNGTQCTCEAVHVTGLYDKKREITLNITEATEVPNQQTTPQDSTEVSNQQTASEGSTGAIVGGVIAAIVFIVVAVGVGIYIGRRTASKHRGNNQVPLSSRPNEDRQAERHSNPDQGLAQDRIQHQQGQHGGDTFGETVEDPTSQYTEIDPDYDIPEVHRSDDIDDGAGYITPISSPYAGASGMETMHQEQTQQMEEETYVDIDAGRTNSAYENIDNSAPKQNSSQYQNLDVGTDCSSS